MYQTATEMTEDLLTRMEALAAGVRRDDLFKLIADRAGLSFGLVRSFYYGDRRNPTRSTLDAMMAAVAAIEQDQAA